MNYISQAWSSILNCNNTQWLSTTSVYIMICNSLLELCKGALMNDNDSSTPQYMWFKINCTDLNWNIEWEQKKADYNPPVQSGVYICSFITCKITTVLKLPKKGKSDPRLAGVSVTLRPQLFGALRTTVFMIMTVTIENFKRPAFMKELQLLKL